jgi:hypothetical protein
MKPTWKNIIIYILIFAIGAGCGYGLSYSRRQQANDTALAAPTPTPTPVREDMTVKDGFVTYQTPYYSLTYNAAKGWVYEKENGLITLYDYIPDGGGKISFRVLSAQAGAPDDLGHSLSEAMQQLDKEWSRYFAFDAGSINGYAAAMSGIQHPDDSSKATPYSSVTSLTYAVTNGKNTVCFAIILNCDKATCEKVYAQQMKAGSYTSGYLFDLGEEIIDTLKLKE